MSCSPSRRSRATSTAIRRLLSWSSAAARAGRPSRRPRRGTRSTRGDRRWAGCPRPRPRPRRRGPRGSSSEAPSRARSASRARTAACPTPSSATRASRQVPSSATAAVAAAPTSAKSPCRRATSSKPKPAVARGRGDMDRREDLAVGQRRREVGHEEVVGLDHPVAAGARDLEAGIEGQQDGRDLGGGIGVGRAAAERAAVADADVPDMTQRRGDERRPLAHVRRPLDVDVARGRADAQAVAVGGDPAQLVDPADVDQQAGTRQAHVQQGQEALAAGDDLRRVIAVERRSSVIDGACA